MWHNFFQTTLRIKSYETKISENSWSAYTGAPVVKKFQYVLIYVHLYVIVTWNCGDSLGITCICLEHIIKDTLWCSVTKNFFSRFPIPNNLHSHTRLRGEWIKYIKIINTAVNLVFHYSAVIGICFQPCNLLSQRHIHSCCQDLGGLDFTTSSTQREEDSNLVHAIQKNFSKTSLR